MTTDDLNHSCLRASRQRLTLNASLKKNNQVLETETINISQSGVLLETKNIPNDFFFIGEYLKLKIEGFILNNSPKTSEHEVIFVRSEPNAVAFEFI